MEGETEDNLNNFEIGCNVISLLSLIEQKQQQQALLLQKICREYFHILHPTAESQNWVIIINICTKPFTNTIYYITSSKIVGLNL